MTYGYQMDGFLKKADYKHSNNIAFVTLNEFTYLAAGFHPLLAGQDSLAYLDLSDKEFKQFYEEIKRLGDELPVRTTKETEVHDWLTPEPKYEAVYLIKWAKSRNKSVSSSYKPIMSAERIRANHLNQIIGMDIVTINDFSALLAVFNPHIENGENHFKNMLLGAIQVGKITPINNSHCYDEGLEERDFIFTIKSLIQLSKDKGFNIPIELSEDSEQSNTSKLVTPFSENEIIKDGLLDLSKIESTKLLLAIENYALNMFGKNKNEIPKSVIIKNELMAKYDLTEPVARQISECSHHDFKVKNPLTSARKKITIC